MRRFSKSKSGGFTLVEIIVVITILGVIAGIAIFSIIHILHNSREKVCVSNRAEIKRLYYIYQTDGGTFNPEGISGIQFLTDSGYVNQDKKICPSGGEIYWGLDDNGRLEVYCTVHREDEDLIYRSNFSALGSVKSLRGSWIVRDGKLMPGGAGENRAIFEGSNGTDYNVKMNAVYLSGRSNNSGYGVYYRATDNSDISGYCFQFDPGMGNEFVVRKVTNGREASPFKRVDMVAAMGPSFSLNDPHDIEIDVRGTTHIIKVDGVEIMNFSDSSFSEGHVGVRTWSDSKVEINEVIIEK